MKKLKIYKIVAVIVAFILVAWVVRVIYLAKKYPAAQIEEVNVGEELIYNDIGYKISKIDMLSSDDINSLIEEYNLDENTLEEKGILIDVEISNYSDEIFKVSPENYMLACNIFGGAMSPYDYYSLNDDFANASFRIEPGVTTSVKMLFRYDKRLLGDKFDTFENMDWSLVLSYYPVKYKLSLI